MTPSPPPSRPRTWAAHGLCTLLAAVAALLSCQGVFDPDVWWHLRGGDWVLRNGPPGLDPFSFGSADRRWIDLHWGFQVLLAAAHAAAGYPGIIAFVAVLAAASVTVGFACRRPGGGPATAALCWVPAVLVMAGRFTPRPEMFSLLFLGVFLAVLYRAQERPRLLWVLPAVQVLWVNTHGLFVFGPFVLGCLLIDRAVRRPSEGRAWWRRAAIVAGLVTTACFVNPYGAAGALFPLELLPKVSEAGNPYKAYIVEFRPVNYPERIQQELLTGVPTDHYPRFAFHLVLLLLPVSFLLPAVWAAAGSVGRPSVWLGSLGGLALAAAGAAVPAYQPVLPDGLTAPCHALPLAFLAAGLAGAAALRGKPAAAVLAATGGAAVAAWAWWLDDYFADPMGGELAFGPAGTLAAAAGLVAAVLVLRHGGSPFALLLAVTFAYLALVAGNSVARFGLVAGVVLSHNLGGWVADVRGPGKARPWLVAAGLAVWVAALTAGWPAGVAGAMLPDPFGSPPLAFPHDAAAFAGRDDLPPHVLAIPLKAANVFVYHHAPGRKVYMDARLEVPTRSTFKNYVDVEQQLLNGQPGWPEAVRAMGNPALLFAHEGYAPAEAAVLAHPDWRLVYFDAVGAVCLPRDAGDKVPTLDLAARHFRRDAGRPVPDVPGAARREAMALANLGIELGRYPAAWSLRVPVVLYALDRSRLAVEEGHNPAAVWLLVGATGFLLHPDARSAPPSPADGWNVHTGIRWAQLSYALRKAREAAPNDARPLLGQYQSYAARRMDDAAHAVGSELLASGRLEAKDEAGVRQRLKPLAEPTGASAAELVRAGYPEAAARRTDAAGWTWDELDRVAAAQMHLGHPDRARALWSKATAVPSEAVRQARVAATYWAERNLDAAADEYRRARQTDPTLADAAWALAWVETERGRAAAALAEVTAAGGGPAWVAKDVADLRRLLEKYAAP